MRELLGDAGRGDDWAWLRLTVAEGRVVDAGGEGPGVRALARAIRGLPLLEAAAVPGESLAAEALAAALGPSVEAPFEPRRVAVAMSGGVDSAVALLRARAEGLEPVGVTLRLWLDPAGPDAERACCSPASVVAARELCHSLGVPHVTLDRRQAFRDRVVRPFVEAYGLGETPNPCTSCNGGLRFPELLAFASRIGAPRLATGHYARIVTHRERLLVARAVDRGKDQSYMLGRLDPALLARLWFPLGDSSKEATRAEARAAGLAAATRPESQEACFLAGGDYRAFLARHGLPERGGPILDLHGREIGHHRGFWHFTPGQRRGLGVASADGGPLYAVQTVPARNAVVAGPRDALARTRVRLREARLYAPAGPVEAKLRYRSPAVGARVGEAGGGRLDLELDEPVHGVAPGQTAVLYEEDAVVGAGIIASAA